MDNLKPLKSFLTDLITPIVQDAVSNAIPDNIKTKDKNPVPVQKITQTYGISQSKVYAMFRTGELEKIKIFFLIQILVCPMTRNGGTTTIRR